MTEANNQMIHKITNEPGDVNLRHQPTNNFHGCNLFKIKSPVLCLPEPLLANDGLYNVVYLLSLHPEY